MALTNKLTAIADAIREKTGTTEPMTLDSMATAISGITGGGGGELTDYIPESALTIIGYCDYMCYKGKWDWFIEKHGDKITTSNLVNTSCMFQNCSLEEIPFILNYKDTTSVKDLTRTFSNSKICKVPTINIPNAQTLILNSIFSNCNYLRDLNGVFENEEAFGASWQSFVNNSQFSNHYVSDLFNCLYSLRTVPTWFYLLKLNPNSSTYIYPSYNFYYETFTSCYSLDEVKNIPVYKCQGDATTNMFTGTFN